MIKFKPLARKELVEFNVTSPDQEFILVMNIFNQIRAWMAKKELPINFVNSLLLNKLTYFTVKELRNINPKILVSGGWYKYGPCLETLRANGERGTTDLKIITPIKIKKIWPEVEKVCTEETNIFYADEKEQTNVKYFYKYLKHVYTDKSEYEDLKDYYITKNELAYLFLKFAFDQKLDPNLKLAFVRFERALMNKDYLKFVNLTESQVTIVFDYLSIMKKLLEIHNNSTLKKNETYWQIVRKIASDFEQDVLGEFAYLNYMATYKDIDKKREKTNKEYFKSQIKDWKEAFESKISSNVDWVSYYINERK